MTITKHTTIGFVTGTSIGFTLGVLFAAKKWKSTRSKLLDKTKQLSNAASLAYQQAQDKYRLLNEVEDHIAV